MFAAVVLAAGLCVEAIAPAYTDGHLALQLHSGGAAQVRWRQLYIKEL